MSTETAAGAGQIADTQARIAQTVVGRRRELELILAAMAAGRDLLLEGPPGTRSPPPTVARPRDPAPYSG